MASCRLLKEGALLVWVETLRIRTRQPHRPRGFYTHLDVFSARVPWPPRVSAMWLMVQLTGKCFRVCGGLGGHGYGIPAHDGGNFEIDKSRLRSEERHERKELF